MDRQRRLAGAALLVADHNHVGAAKFGIIILEIHAAANQYFGESRAIEGLPAPGNPRCVPLISTWLRMADNARNIRKLRARGALQRVDFLMRRGDGRVAVDPAVKHAEKSPTRGAE